MAWSGAIVFTPVGHSPDVDLVADFGAGPLRIEVKTTMNFRDGRWQAMLATMGGNQSWSGVVKSFDHLRCDYLFVHVGDGRRWFIPAGAIDCKRSISLGGNKYARFEISPGKPLTTALPLQSSARLGECQSGQMDGAVNAAATPSQVRILPPPSNTMRTGFKPSKYERNLGKSGEANINPKRRVTIPQSAAAAADLRVGDRLRVSSVGNGRLLLERLELPPSLTTPATTAPAAGA